MLDTIVLTIPWGHFMITDHNKFSPSTENLVAGTKFGSRGFAKYTQNPTKAETFEGEYKPRLTITDRAGSGRNLKIEFSVPKLLFGNNVDEVTEEDFPEILETLKTRLSSMGIKVLVPILENAAVSVIHFSKNLPLTDHFTSSYVIKELGKLDVTKWLDLNNRFFQNNGHALYFYSSSYHIIFYDKVKDINSPLAKAVDKEKTAGQLQLFEQTKNPGELLRFEIRLTKKQKLNSILTFLGFRENPTFKEIFSHSVAKQVLLHFWKQIYSPKTMFVLTSDEEPQKLLEQVITSSKAEGKRISAEAALAFIGAVIYAKEHGIRGLRSAIECKYSDRTWLRLNKRLNQLSKANTANTRLGYIKQIETGLSEFKPLRMADLGEVK